MDVIVYEILDIGITSKEPKELVDDAFEKYFFGRQKGKSFTQIKTHLMSENRCCSCSSSISFLGSFLHDFAKKIQVLFIDVVHEKSGEIKNIILRLFVCFLPFSATEISQEFLKRNFCIRDVFY